MTWAICLAHLELLLSCDMIYLTPLLYIFNTMNLLETRANPRLQISVSSVRFLRQMICFAFSELGYFELKVSQLEAVLVMQKFLVCLLTAVEGKSLFLLCCSSEQ